MTYGRDAQPTTSPYLNEPSRSHEQAVFEVTDKHHRMALGEMLQWMEQARLQYMNAPGPAGFLSTYDKRINALKYAIEKLNNAAAERIKQRSVLEAS